MTDKAGKLSEPTVDGYMDKNRQGRMVRQKSLSQRLLQCAIHSLSIISGAININLMVIRSSSRCIKEAMSNPAEELAR